MTPIEILGLVVTGLITVRFVLYLRSGDLKEDFGCLKSLKGWSWVSAIFSSWAILLLVVAIGLALHQLSPQFFGWSWLKLLATPKEIPTAGSNLLLSGLKFPIFAWFFWALLVINIPGLALNEEYAFRKDVTEPKLIAFQSVKFGLAHCIVGIPISFGIGLIVAGFWFAHQYKLGGVERSGAFHTIHNWTLALIAGLWLAKLI